MTVPDQTVVVLPVAALAASGSVVDSRSTVMILNARRRLLSSLARMALSARPIRCIVSPQLVG